MFGVFGLTPCSIFGCTKGVDHDKGLFECGKEQVFDSFRVERIRHCVSLLEQSGSRWLVEDLSPQWVELVPLSLSLKEYR